MYRVTLLCLIAWIITPSCYQPSKIQRQGTSAIPVLKVMNDTENPALPISKLAIDVEVVGNIATTIFDIIFYNSHDKVLEGEFNFPLADGQNISRYALDINGNLREGVVVEKAKARVAFENTVRQRIDPGLVEKTKGNNFRTRIYPIPAKGYKRVVIGIEQQLAYNNKQLFYQLPLYSPELIRNFSIKTTVFNNINKPSLQDTGLNNFTFHKWRNAWLAEYTQKDFEANTTIAFSIPFAADSDNTLFTEEHNGKTYFYLNAAIEPKYESKPKPALIVMLWDISASANKRDIIKESELIEKYISSLQNVTVELIPFHIAPQDKEVFIINDGDASSLLKRLTAYQFDGGTQLGAIDLTKYKADEILLFSDGLSTFGKHEMHLSSVPVISINSSSGADFSNLKFISGQTHGKFLDLTKLETDAAVTDLQAAPLQLINTSFNAGDAEEIYTGTATTMHNGFSMSGILIKPSATITVNFGYGNTISKSKVYTIGQHKGVQYDNVKRIWASMKIAQLDLRYENNKEAITKHGKEFSIVTQNTSLLVLDRVEDYVQYEIVPPSELQKDYYELLTHKLSIKSDVKGMALQEAIEDMKELKQWWNNDIKPAKNNRELSRFTTPQIANDREVGEDTADYGKGSVDLKKDEVNYDETTIGTINSEGIADAGLVAPPPPPSTLRSLQSVTSRQEEPNQVITQDVQLVDIVFTKVENMPKHAERKLIIRSTIDLNEWKPNAPYLKILETTPSDKYFEKYIVLKNDYPDQPSFFVDVARFLYEKKDTALALQVLSNISELKLEDAELLRIVANQLLEAGKSELAIETFKDILKIREEEPQSYRDLALALNEAGQYNEAVELLYKIVTGVWSDRFDGIKSVVLNELNAIISAHPGVNTGGIDKQFITAMPVDVRIIISWSTDNADIDLWVTEPNKQVCDYQKPLTENGGKISGDIMAGYGPEEYMIKNASDGNYIIKANLFGDSRQTLGGPITVKAALFTNFGRTTQEIKVINFSVTTNKQLVKIGELRFGQ